MRPADQIVRHTMAIGATGFPDILVDLLTTLGYRWYPQYTVWELFREFNQELYRAVVRIYDRSNHSTNLLHTFDGYGVTEEMSVQEAAFVAITCLRGLYPRLETTPFRYIPYAPVGVEDRFYTAVCTPYETRRYDARHLVRYTEALDHSVRALTSELILTRNRLYEALTQLMPRRNRGTAAEIVYIPGRTEFPPGLAWPALEGYVPARGLLLPPSMREEHRSIHAMQPAVAASSQMIWHTQLPDYVALPRR
jgi:hypothetical protein